MDRTAPDAAPSQAGHGGHTRIMIVDDHDDLRDLLRAQLASIPGILVVGEARDGAEAVELAPGLNPDVVFMDLAMPVMDGLTAIPLLLEALPHLRVIVHSGFDQGMAAQAALKAGASIYLEKGRRTDFGQVIRDVLAGA